MTRQYEAVYIFDSALEEASVTEHLNRFHELLASPSAEAPSCDHWGKRTLAYPIRNHETGYYVVAKFESAAEALPEYERAVKLEDAVIRHLIVLNDGPQPVAPEDRPSSDDKEDDE